jgi:pimeloyl-ACP methyl ester carboxylesterase
MIQERYVPIKEGVTLFLRHNELKEERKTLLLVHGLGESGLCFQEIFNEPGFEAFNLLVPDMPGYGRSSGAADYRFDLQVQHLAQLVEHIGKDIPVGELIVIGHSLGGDLTTLFCDRYMEELDIKGYVNIEGDITPHQQFISGQADDAYRQGGQPQFEAWFETFANRQVYHDWAEKFGESARRYYASLRFCRPEAFLQNAQELVERNRRPKHDKIESEIDHTYISVARRVATVYRSMGCQPSPSRVPVIGR